MTPDVDELRTIKTLVKEFRSRMVHGVDCKDAYHCDLLERTHRHWSDEEIHALERLFQAAAL